MGVQGSSGSRLDRNLEQCGQTRALIYDSEANRKAPAETEASVDPAP